MRKKQRAVSGGVLFAFCFCCQHGSRPTLYCAFSSIVSVGLILAKDAKSDIS